MRKHLSCTVILFLIVFPSLICAQQAGTQSQQVQQTTTETPSQQISSTENSHLTVALAGNWQPFNFANDNGEVVGIIPDFTKLIMDNAGLNYKVERKPYWSDVLGAVETNAADLTLGNSILVGEWEKIGLLSEPFTHVPIVIATEKSAAYVEDFSTLAGKKIAIGKNYNAYYLMKQNYPNIHIVEVATTYEGLELLNKGEVFAVADVLPVILNRINNMAYSNIEIGGISSIVMDVRALISHQNSELLPVINKAIADISAEQRSNIMDKWLGYESHLEVHSKDFLSLIITFFVVVSLILLIIFRKFN
ncbi:transporter substrate-binding domain-containing protein [Thalassotalea psychrophila]|uniref:Transporter substrate-binding domain-containing protein n=1 Tax=Thalassotalea psychrophila TaxID=3065647 RepID=A0ABY9TQY7_9GAMM|nr:transporter substrate-binding domain-containing protein [Colwelliaceae bacterium SQ149]